MVDRSSSRSQTSWAGPRERSVPAKPAIFEATPLSLSLAQNRIYLSTRTQVLVSIYISAMPAENGFSINVP